MGLVNCIVCGKQFEPYADDDVCCSATCRTMHRLKEFEEAKAKKKDSIKARLDALTKPPKFDLNSDPMARVSWFMSLPAEYKRKFNRYLTPQEKEWARGIEQKKLAEERFFTGFYVKNGKIIDQNKKNAEDKEPEQSQQPSEEEED